MSHRATSSLAILAFLLGAGSGLAACSSDSGGSASGDSPSGAAASGSASATTSQSGGAVGLPAPVMATPEDLSGKTFTIREDRPLVVTVDNPDGWTGTTADPAVATFRAGGATGSSTSNPGFLAQGPGTTTATLTDPSGTVHEFTLTVEK